MQENPRAQARVPVPQRQEDPRAQAEAYATEAPLADRGKQGKLKGRRYRGQEDSGGHAEEGWEKIFFGGGGGAVGFGTCEGGPEVPGRKTFPQCVERRDGCTLQCL